ncbi:MAG: hypothetical protein AVDCRST_MAG89-3295 [uncultured Gemmatimonadetes bacterium]|uniref:Uncharacterized protein n=1 Tax=uncultured Gemmatimonadota bacterium TaxID=203437 RepID=A0A6J4MC71_9BACT|nr:MAG: hypothetical protein AVDCRST_MAG89-3295 [uncultured Gemmatimonadota bacterium]
MLDGNYSLGAMSAAASEDVSTGMTSKSTRSLHCSIHSSSSSRRSHSITWKHRPRSGVTQLLTYRSPSGASRPRSRKRR